MKTEKNQYENLIAYKPDIFTRALSPEQCLVLGLTLFEEKLYHIIASKTGGGYNQDGIPLSLKDFCILSGLGKNTVVNSLKSLEEKKLISKKNVREGKVNGVTYSLVYLPNTPLTEAQLNELNTKLSPAPIPDPKNPYGI